MSPCSADETRARRSPRSVLTAARWPRDGARPAGLRQALAAAPADSRRAAPRRRQRPATPAELRRHPDRRPDARRALRRLHARPAAATIEAMPNTLRPDRRTRRHLQPLLRRPTRSAAPRGSRLLTGRYAHNHNVRGNVPPNGGYPGFASRAAPTATTSRPGCRAPATARSTSASSSTATATSRTTTAPTVPPGWSAWHIVLNSDTDHYFYGYSLNNNGMIEGPFGDSGSWETREYGDRDDFGCPLRPAQRAALLLRDRRLQPASRRKSCRGRRRTSPSTCSSTTPPRTATSAGRPGPSRRRATTTRSPAPRSRHSPSEGLQRGQRQRQAAASSAKRPTCRRADIHTYRVYYQKALESLRAVDDGVKQIVDTLGALHRLRNTYIIFTSDNGFFFGEHRLDRRQVPRLRALDPPALPDPRPGDQAGHRKPASWRRTSTSRRRSSNWPTPKPDKSIDGRSLVPLRARPQPAHPPPDSSSSPSSRPTTSKRTAARPPIEPALGAGRRSRPAPAAGQAPAPRSWRRRRTTTGSASAPTSTSSGPTARKSSTTSPRTPTSSTTRSATPTSSRSAPSCTAQLMPARELRRAHLPGSRSEIPADPRPAAQGSIREEERNSANARTEQAASEQAESTHQGSKAASRRSGRVLRHSPLVERPSPDLRSPPLLDDGEDVAGLTAAPSATLRVVTLPARWAAISFSIFIASITQTRSPSSTSAPCSTATLKTVPCSGEGERLAGGAGTAARLALALRRLPPAGRGRGAAGARLADHLDVEELAGDLDLVVAADDLGALLGRGRGGLLRRGRLQPVAVLHQVAAGLAARPTARWRGSPCGRGSGWSGRRPRTRRAPAASAASRARGRRPRRSAWPPSGRTSASPRSPPRRRSRRGRRGRPARGRW